MEGSTYGITEKLGYCIISRENVQQLFSVKPFVGIEAERGSYLRAVMTRSGVRRGVGFNGPVAKFVNGIHLLYFRDEEKNHTEFYFKGDKQDWIKLQPQIQMHFLYPEEGRLFEPWPRNDRSSVSVIDTRTIKANLQSPEKSGSVIQFKDSLPYPKLLELITVNGKTPEVIVEEQMEKANVRRGWDFFGPVFIVSNGARIYYKRVHPASPQFIVYPKPTEPATATAIYRFAQTGKNIEGLSLVI